MLFWLCAAFLLALALALIVPPLMGAGRRSPGASETDGAVGAYRARLAELEEEHRLGMLGEADLEQARIELARELLAEDSSPGHRDDAARPGGPGAHPRPWIAVAVAVLLPAVTLVLYGWLGEPAALQQPAPSAAAAGSNEPHAGTGELESMTAHLAERMRAEPDNVEGWLLLARSYMTLRHYTEAAEAYGAAHRLVGDDPALLADLGQAEALAQGENFLGKAGEHLERALALDPQQPKALWLGGFAAAQRGEPALAAVRWNRLLEHQAPDSEGARILRELIAGIAGEAPAPAPPGGQPANSRGLEVKVRLDERLREQVDQDATVYVFARAVEGPPMPLAVVRTKVANLPATVRLDDSTAMAQGMKLSAFPRVIVGARISVSGDARASSGDLQGLSPPVEVAGGGPVEVVITDVVP